MAAATFSDLSTISQNANFESRVAYAMAAAAVNVYSEPPATAGHAARAAFATRVLAGNYNIQYVANAVLTNATIAAAANILTTPGYAITDANIQVAVNSLWDALAGA